MKIIKKNTQLYIFFIYTLFFFSNNTVQTINIRKAWRAIKDKFKLYKTILDRLNTPQFIPQTLSSVDYSLEKAIYKSINYTGVEENFAMSYNEFNKKSKGIHTLLGEMILTFTGSLKDFFMAEKLYEEKKRNVYSIYIPKSLKNNDSVIDIKSAHDLKKLMKQLNSKLILSSQQLKDLAHILIQMQLNIKKVIKDPDNAYKYTTQVSLSGPPGTGKTQLIYLISELMKTPILVLSTSNLILLGYDSLRVLRDILYEVKMTGIMLYIDEAELLFIKREELLNLAKESYEAEGNQKSNPTELSEVLHKLLTIFLSETGNQQHNLFISSNKFDIIDSAIARRIKYSFTLHLPDNETLTEIIKYYIKFYNLELMDISEKETINLILQYNNNLTQSNMKKNKTVGFSGSDIKVMMMTLKDMNIININDKFPATKNQLINVIEERVDIYKHFGSSLSVDSGGGISFGEEEAFETEFDRLEKLRNAKRQENYNKMNALSRAKLIQYQLNNSTYFPKYNFIHKIFIQQKHHNNNNILNFKKANKSLEQEIYSALQIPFNNHEKFKKNIIRPIHHNKILYQLIEDKKTINSQYAIGNFLLSKNFNYLLFTEDKSSTNNKTIQDKSSLPNLISKPNNNKQLLFNLENQLNKDILRINYIDSNPDDYMC